MSSSSVIPYEPTAAEKSSALGHLFYELQQMWGAAHLSSKDFIQNALVESYLVHVRVLLEFFEHEVRTSRRDGSVRSENDDVLSKDFGFPARAINLARIYRERLNKDLVHLAYSRTNRLSKHWVICEVVAPVAARGARFIETVGPKQLSSLVGPSSGDWTALRDNLLALARGCGVNDEDT